ncbi:MAG: stage 0 sporulation family protein [Clostridia bacterium]|nr:stage 0 sporulation family protein [Clostridia bacterium]
MQKIIGVKLNQSGKISYFLPSGIEYNIGDVVIVEDDKSQLAGKVCFGEKLVDETELDHEIPKVLRRATKADLEKIAENSAKAEKAVKTTRQKTKELGLSMKVVSAEYSLDGSKVIISFTADDRVDFRDLLKELASALHSRIELKQIGQRDEVKIKGGIGPCGEECCCKRFLKDFEHVTIKMAKTQNLSLSPTKISGLCGRLMCCLGYENPTYEEIQKKMPKVGLTVSTPDGIGQVIYNDLLREQVSVKFTANDDTTTISVYPLEKIKVEQKKERENGFQNKPKQVH